MNELSLHILDIVENSINAEASIVKLDIIENTIKNTYEIIVEDDGKGMSEEVLKTVTDPFYTTRTTRKVGLGISLFKMAAELTEGSLTVNSTEGVGTKVHVVFTHNHIDRAPLGDIAQTIISLVNRGSSDIVYTHIINDKEFTFSTIEVKAVLEGIPLDEPSVMMWMRNNIDKGLNGLEN